MGQTFSGMGQSDPSKMGTGTKLAESGTQGLAQGFANQQNQPMRQGGGAVPLPPPQAPVSPDYFAPQAPQPSQIRKPNNNFYGGGM
jgi:hypothetical protein